MSQNTQEIVKQIISLKDSDGELFINRFTTEFVLATFQRQQIEITELFTRYKKDGFELLEFVRFFLNIVQHRSVETLYLTMALVDLFNLISKELHQSRVTFRDMTDFLCQRILKGASNINRIEAKLGPIIHLVCPDAHSNQPVQQSPVIYGEIDLSGYKLCQKSLKMDCTKRSKAIIKSYFCSDLRKTFLLESLAECIQIYDQNCRPVGKIKPNKAKVRKEIIILSFAFSRRQYRLGATLRDSSIKFWDHQNDFQYEKTISTVTQSQQLQTGIYFLEHCNAWVTVDKIGTLAFWSLEEERVTRWMKTKYSSAIHDLAEIAHLNLIALAQEKIKSQSIEASILLYNFYTGALVTEIPLENNRIPHTIQYSETYQVLFSGGLEKNIKVYELHPTFLDAISKGELVGHENLVTTFCIVTNKPLLVSADDKGKVKLWDFRCLTCLQTLDFTNKTAITNVLSMGSINKIGMFGSRINYICFERSLPDNSNIGKQKIDSIDIDEPHGEIFAFGSPILRVIDLSLGTVKRFFNLSNSDEQEYTFFKYFASLRRFVLGNSKGEVSIYECDTGQIQYSLKTLHEGAISFVQYDELNKLFITVGLDSNILIHRESDGNCLREMRDNFKISGYCGNISSIEVSVYHNLIVIGAETSQSLYFWNYEFGKIIAEIVLPEQNTPSLMHFVNGFGLLFVVTNEKQLLVFQLTGKDTSDNIAHLICLRNTPGSIVSLNSSLTIKGNNLNLAMISHLVLLLTYDDGRIQEIALTDLIENKIISASKQKVNYYPYRECKESFNSQLQKKKHQRIICSPQERGWSIFDSAKSFRSEMGAVQILRNLQMGQIGLQYLLGLGAEGRRIQIWNRSKQVVCDMNVKYSLPYKWDVCETKASRLTEKVYVGIKVLEAITQKYRLTISSREARNLELKELLSYVQESSVPVYKEQGQIEENHEGFLTQVDSNRVEIISKAKNVLLLQNQYSRKDLNFELAKQFHFSEIAGPALKEMDYLKNVRQIQKQWRQKEVQGESEKKQLMKTIQLKAQRNQQKQQLQNLFTKRNKGKTSSDAISCSLSKRIFQFEHRTEIPDQKSVYPLLHTDSTKPMFRCFENKFSCIKGETATTFQPLRTSTQATSKNNKFKRTALTSSSNRIKKSFQEYYQKKHGFMEQNFGMILMSMDRKVKSVQKKRRDPTVDINTQLHDAYA